MTPTPAFRPEHLDILRLLVRGLGPELICRDLKLPMGTVRSRIQRMRTLARCVNTAELIYAAGRYGWLELNLTPGVAAGLLELERLLNEDASIGALKQAAARVREERGRGR